MLTIASPRLLVLGLWTPVCMERKLSVQFVRHCLTMLLWPYSLELNSEIISKMPTYLETITQYRNPGELSKTGSTFQFARDTNLKFFEWLQEHPESRMHFEKVMDDHNEWFRFGEPTGLAAMYPFEQELGHDTGDDDVLLVDVAGGRGQILIDVHKHLPNLKGRLILENLRLTFSDLDSSSEIKVLEYNFIDPQPIAGRFPLTMVAEPSRLAKVL